MKRCAACGAVLAIDCFYKHHETRDRRFAACKRCVCERQRKKRTPETLDDRHRLRAAPMRRQGERNDRAYLLGVWAFTGAACMRCAAPARVALLVKQLGERPIALRLCAQHHRAALVATSN